MSADIRFRPVSPGPSLYLGIIMTFAALLVVPAQADVGDVLRSFSAPGYYSTGLTWDGSHLWVANIADAAHPENSWYKFYRLDPSTGTPVDSFSTSPSYYHGIGWDGKYLWGAHNWNTLTRHTTSGAPNRNIDAPELFTYGVTYVPSESVLWVSVFQGETGLYKLDPQDGTVLGQIRPAEGTTTNGWADLAWDGTSLWHSNTADEVIYEIDPNDGSILSSFASPGQNCSGVAFDGEFLWLASHVTDLIYKVDIGFVSTGVESGMPLSAGPALFLKPNPSRGPVQMEILPKGGGPASVILFDVRGRQVRELYSGNIGRDGRMLQWNGRDDRGREVAAGVYLVRVETETRSSTRRITIVR